MSGNAYTKLLNQRILALEQEILDLKETIQQIQNNLQTLMDRPYDSDHQCYKQPECPRCHIALDDTTRHFHLRNHCKDCVCPMCDTKPIEVLDQWCYNCS